MYSKLLILSFVLIELFFYCKCQQSETFSEATLKELDEDPNQIKMLQIVIFIFLIINFFFNIFL